MTMEEVFRHRSVFKQKVIEGVQAELDQFGLRIYNANVKELEVSGYCATPIILSFCFT